MSDDNNVIINFAGGALTSVLCMCVWVCVCVLVSVCACVRGVLGPHFIICVHVDISEYWT